MAAIFGGSSEILDADAATAKLSQIDISGSGKGGMSIREAGE
jgi:hypothetical protein